MASDQPLSAAQVRPMQIVALVLPAGVVAFLGVVLFIVYGGGAQAPAQAPAQAADRLPIVTIMAGVFFVIAASLSFIVPEIVALGMLKQLVARPAAGDARSLLGLRQTTLIIGLALLEGSAFFGTIALLVERQPLILIVPGLALLLIFARFPTENSVRNWMDARGRRLEEMRSDRPSS